MLKSTVNRRHAFTLVEMIVVVGIIVVLVGVLLPVADKVWRQQYVVTSQNAIARIAGGIERYQADFRAYPGFLSNEDISNKRLQLGTSGPRLSCDTGTVTCLTSTECMVLSVLGGVELTVGSGSTVTAFKYDRNLIGRGIINLNPKNPKRYPAYLTVNPDELTALNDNRKENEVGSIVPEIQDGFGDGGAVLYLRAKPGMVQIVDTDNKSAQYNYAHVQNFYRNPLDNSAIFANANAAREYFYNPKAGGDPKQSLSASNPLQVRQKDSYILMSAGPDRKYGTTDDICNFGPVK